MNKFVNIADHCKNLEGLLSALTRIDPFIGAFIEEYHHRQWGRWPESYAEIERINDEIEAFKKQWHEAKQ